jgi:competence ComEA-like helix-hairpin-helix protein
VDINNATSSELLEINGIGKAKATKIIEYRELNKCFKSIDELSKIEGISKQLVDKNRDELSLGVCQATVVKSNFTPSAFKDVLLDPVNLVFVIFIFMLAVLDLKTKKDFKSQIVSVGVLGTFVGIFIGLQNFNPEDIINSVNDILLGLKTAFFTSIVGMSVATVLSIIEKLKDEPESK